MPTGLLSVLYTPYSVGGGGGGVRVFSFIVAVNGVSEENEMYNHSLTVICIKLSMY